MDDAFVSARPRLTVRGEVRPDLAEAVSALTVNRPIHGMAHAEIQVVFWGAADEDPSPQYRFTDIALGDAVAIAFGEGEETAVFAGEITAIEERYGGGAPRLVLLLQDPLHRLARRRQSRTFDDRSLDDLIGGIAADAGLRGDAAVSGLPATWHQINESDLAFLFRLLEPFGICLRLEDGVLRARPEQPVAEPIRLSISDNALTVRVIADLNRQPAETGVRGFDPQGDQVLTGSVQATRDGVDGRTAADLLRTLGWPGEEQMPRPFPWLQGLADAFAQGHFDRRARAFVAGSIECIGDPRLAAGGQVDLSGVSERLAGPYLVVHCVHRFDAATGYRTQLRVSRPDLRG